jgi:Ni/Fe-hydrogenase 1 B-type cytochrome subunit
MATLPRADGRRPARDRSSDSLTGGLGTDEKVTVKVWDLPVRVTHWVNVFSILVLSVTGYYIMDPFLGTLGPATGQFLMGTVRFVHFATAFIFTVSVLFRVGWAFVGNEYARWSQFLPVSGGRLRSLGKMVRYYTFLRREPPAEVGHNPLAGITYIAIYALFGLQIVTGFALYGLDDPTSFWAFAFGWVFPLVSIPFVRLMHTLIMFLLIAFTIHHVYSAVLIDVEEKSGLLSSIVTGYKTLTRRHIAEARAEDAPRPRRPGNASAR